MMISRPGRVVLLVVVVLVLAAVVGCSRGGKEQTATSGNLTACVSESHLELFQAEAEQFNSLYKDASVVVVGASTREAIVNLINDSVQVIAVDRKLNVEEQAVVKKEHIDLQEVQIAEDALAVVVNRVNETEVFSMESLRDMVWGRVTDWGQVPGSGLTGTIEVVLTGRNSGTYEILKDHFFSEAEDIPIAVAAASEREVIEYVAKHPQALGVVSTASYRSPSVAAVTDSSGGVKALAFAGVDSTGHEVRHRLHQANIHLGRYPLHYPVYVYFRKNSNIAVGFAGFVAGAEGQKIILDWGLVPATMPVRIVTLT
jgi:phosphate transport system substrate-binding protein